MQYCHPPTTFRPSKFFRVIRLVAPDKLPLKWHFLSVCTIWPMIFEISQIILRSNILRHHFYLAKVNNTGPK